MDSTQFKEFMKQQQQLTEIVRLLAAQQSLSPTKSNVNDDSTSKKLGISRTTNSIQIRHR